ncbi:DUF5302 domain-containing protein [Actinopolymorpha alba]|uniref:DUF5302 domain-containing protein n=1 Tax=Actinopolymorpha alba TaxID=533267 RepID=UPI000A0206A2
MLGQDQTHDEASPAESPAEAASGEEPSSPDAAGSEESEEDVRRKFRESLDRKRRQHHDRREADANLTSSKVQDGFGPARSKRSFRRKSGG